MEKRNKKNIRITVPLMFQDGMKVCGANGVAGVVRLERLVITPIKGSTRLNLIEQEYKITPVDPNDKFSI